MVSEIDHRKNNFAALEPHTQEGVLQKIDLLSAKFPRIYALFRKLANTLKKSASKEQRQQRYDAFLEDNPYLKEDAQWLNGNLYRPNDAQPDPFNQTNSNSLDHHNYVTVVADRADTTPNEPVTIPIDDLIMQLEQLTAEIPD